ncbi:biotin/lipoyl-containing protein [Candidatus Solincola tengchongensis]|uniref:acetyl-CoA carboxylase biotin carboxyl carrier protein n=1 Tax=Candidatus Solincola tengchongensis TaxID=2900693 RepID=UPI002580F070|nr:biotin/lipoyl-containing protein [Candidatus Solincola tengchongensis]
MDHLRGIGEFMRREGIRELEVEDGEWRIYLRLALPTEAEPATREGPGELITSPLAGILHLSYPGERGPCCAPGEHRKRGEVLFYVEALKHLNEVHAPFDLVVEEVLLPDGALVSEGQAVLRVKKELPC